MSPYLQLARPNVHIGTTDEDTQGLVHMEQALGEGPAQACLQSGGRQGRTGQKYGLKVAKGAGGRCRPATA
jgi:hypothetical protein